MRNINKETTTDRSKKDQKVVKFITTLFIDKYLENGLKSNKNITKNILKFTLPKFICEHMREFM